LSGPFVEGAPAIGAGELVDFRCDDGSGEWVGCGPGVVVPGRVGRERRDPVPGRDVLRQARVAGVDQLQHRCRPIRAAEVTVEAEPKLLLRFLAAAGVSIARQVDEVEA